MLMSDIWHTLAGRRRKFNWKWRKHPNRPFLSFLSSFTSISQFAVCHDNIWTIFVFPLWRFFKTQFRINLRRWKQIHKLVGYLFLVGCQKLVNRCFFSASQPLDYRARTEDNINREKFISIFYFGLQSYIEPDLIYFWPHLSFEDDSK